MESLTVEELQRYADEVVDRAASGERITVTRDGRAVALLVPFGRTPVGLAELRERRRSLPYLDLSALRSDLGRVITSDL
jgi:prevent-host-death family protein